MTEQEQQIALAEWSGLHTFIPDKNKVDSILCPVCKVCGKGKQVHANPNYNDLNVLHELEKKLPMGQLVDYGKHLNRMELSYNYGYVECVINASAPQRREAILRTIGRWRE